MPKKKTNKSAASRFKVTATGKLLRNRPGRRHKLTKKSSQRKRRLASPALVADSVLKTYKRMIGV